jgi:putative transposase
VTAVRNDLLSEGKDLSLVRLCRVVGVPRSTTYYQAHERVPRPLDEPLTAEIHEVIEAFPTFGIRRVWAHLRYRKHRMVNRKKVARIMRRKGWTMHKRPKGGRPRVQIRRSVASRPNERWSTDVALVFCGIDGWCSFVPVVDCCTRQVLGWELSHTARARTAQRALEEALLGRFGWTHGAPAGMVLRHDNGLVFGARHYRQTVSEYGLSQEFITPYTPEDNGLCERFIRSFKEECVWQHSFESLAQAREVITQWLRWYNEERPHQALEYRTPDETYAALQSNAA